MLGIDCKMGRGGYCELEIVSMCSWTVCLKEHKSPRGQRERGFKPHRTPVILDTQNWMTVRSEFDHESTFFSAPAGPGLNS
jgi:hypothetical protein